MFLLSEGLKMKKLLIVFFLLNGIVFAQCPDYKRVYVGDDKLESFNRKMFEFNLRMNQYALRPVNVLWASIMPQYGIDRIQGVCNNIEYPKRFVSSLIQRDFKASGTATLRFLTNTTLGLGGMFDPAKRFFNLKQVDEDMEQALSSIHVKPGGCIVLPALMPTTPRGLAGKALDAALNPTSYIVSPVLAIVKAGLMLNKTSAIQPMAKFVEDNCADPYDIARKFFAIQNYIKCANLDRKDILKTEIEKVERNNDSNMVDVNADTGEGELVSATDLVKNGDDIIKNYNLDNSKLMADVVLFDYNPQCPVVDAMRTSFFSVEGTNSKFWNEMSVWNRCFSRKIKSSLIELSPKREKYRYKYILQKEKTAPLAIIYPSIGEGVSSLHSVMFAKIFYDEGYSVIIQGSHFHPDFVKSMPSEYKPGIPSVDADYLKIITTKIISELRQKYGIAPREKMFFGTSFGAMAALFLADKEYKNNTLGKIRVVSVCPPVELEYAMMQVDKNMSDWEPEDFKNNSALTAAKMLDYFQNQKRGEIESLPFSESEGKLLTSFLLNLRLSDLIFTIENKSRCKCCSDFYDKEISYSKYAKDYFGDNLKGTDLHSISEYLSNADNYKIYEALDDYMTSPKQLKMLKSYTGNNSVFMSNCSHLGFIYRQEFLNSLKNDIKLSQNR